MKRNKNFQIFFSLYQYVTHYLLQKYNKKKSLKMVNSLAESAWNQQTFRQFFIFDMSIKENTCTRTKKKRKKLVQVSYQSCLTKPVLKRECCPNIHICFKIVVNSVNIQCRPQDKRQRREARQIQLGLNQTFRCNICGRMFNVRIGFISH